MVEPRPHAFNEFICAQEAALRAGDTCPASHGARYYTRAARMGRWATVWRFLALVRTAGFQIQ